MFNADRCKMPLCSCLSVITTFTLLQGMSEVNTQCVRAHLITSVIGIVFK